MVQYFVTGLTDLDCYPRSSPIILLRGYNVEDIKDLTSVLSSLSLTSVRRTLVD